MGSTTVTIDGARRSGRCGSPATGRKLVFDGFMKVAGVTSEDQILPALETGDQVG
jgi:DNA topoisomerase IA